MSPRHCVDLVDTIRSIRMVEIINSAICKLLDGVVVDSAGIAMLESTSVLGLLAHADGSARLTSGGTTVLVHVSGPGEVRLRNELIDKAYIEVSFRPAVGVAGTREKLLEHFIKKILDGVVLAALHPRTSISVFVQVIENNGSVRL